jgi:integrase
MTRQTDGSKHKVNLTPRFLDALEKRPAPPGKWYDVWDTQLPHFGVRVSDKGLRTFIVMKRRRGSAHPARFKIGRYPVLKLSEARDAARIAINDLDEGRAPAERKQQAIDAEAKSRQNTFGAVAEEFIKRHVAKLRSADIAEGVIRRELLGQLLKDGEWQDNRRSRRWRDRPITDITRRDVVKLLEEIVDSGRPHLARLVLAYARKLFRWAIGRDEYGLEANPCSEVSAKDHGAPTVARQVTVANDHLRLIWTAADTLGEPFAPFVKMLILSGQRRNEIARLRWSEIDMAEKVVILPAERMKAKRPHELPLSSPMLSLLEGITRGKGDYVFSTTDGNAPISGFAKLKTRLDKAIAKEAGGSDKLPAWRLHDLRRTMRTGLGAIPEIAHDVRELVIAHVPPTLVRTYDLHSYRQERRQALEVWGQRVARIIEPAPDGKVVPLRGNLA